MNNAYTYATKFFLTDPVNDLEAARNYLKEPGMIDFLKDDPRLLKYDFADDDIESLTNIEWKLYDESSGEIVLTSNKKLTKRQLEGVSDWISGQCSDGLGEGFEQQDFACYRDEDGCYYGGYDEEEEQWVQASFDWLTNSYELTLVR